MRIGILTFCNAYNLGAALQAFSLQKKLEDMGNQSELIDYRCPAIEKMHQLRPVFRRGLKPKARVYNLLYNFVFPARRKRFQHFQQEMKRSQVYMRENIGETNGKYDLFLSGSDQVFNLNLTEQDSTYFLDFVKDGKKGSYAASLGPYLPEQKENYINWLKDFDFLSVREQASAEILKQELGINADIMPDPVFLHSMEEWRELLGIQEKNTEKYVLIYALIEKPELYAIAEKVSKEKKLKIYVITKIIKPRGKADKIFKNVGPKEFVELLSNAEYIVTNSFHGTAFSLIFKKQFTILRPENAPERIEDLLRDVKLNHRMTSSAQDIDLSDIDYSLCEEAISCYGKKGIDYLQRICKEVESKA